MGDEDGRWRLVQWTLEDLEATQGSSSVRSAGLKSILSSGYVHDVHIDPQNFVSAWVESDHNMKRAYLSRVHIGDHRVISSTCTCTTLDYKLCKHRYGLLYACVILANDITEHPKWLKRFPPYHCWLDTITAYIPCKSFNDLRRFLLSELPPEFERQSTKKKKQAGGRAAKPLDTARLARQRPKDTRLVGGAVGPRARRTPAHLKDYATPPPSAATARRGPTTR